MSAETCGPEGCGDCTLACAAGPADTSGAGEELAVVAASGFVIALLAGAVALGAVTWVATIAGITAGAGAALAGAALVARSSRPAGPGSAFADMPVRLLPYVTAALIVTILARAAAAVVA